MTSQTTICECISRSRKCCITLLALVAVMLAPLRMAAQEQRVAIVMQKDTIPLFCGFSVQFNIAGVATKMLSDRGEIEGALRINLRDKYFPIVELGYGIADHDDEVTGWRYKTKAPFMRVGMDWNLLRNKHTGNRLYGGLRYGFTMYKADIMHPGLADPVWGSIMPVEQFGEKCNQHWAELVFGVEAKIAGPLHLGWNVRYKRRIKHKDPSIGNAWYVPGFGKAGNVCWGADFNVIIDI